jgi:4-hydroxy-4-methyl-2-oxoglutarate aldolase
MKRRSLGTSGSADFIEQLRQFDPATLYEAAGKRGMVDPAIKPAWLGAKLCGPAVTVECSPGDNLMLHRAVTITAPGDILVVTTNNHLTAGAWGEVLTVAAQTRSLGGLVIDGAVRDTEAVSKLGFPIFSRGSAIGSCSKSELGRINEAINFGGVRVKPGDIVLGDGDGLVIIERHRLNEVLLAARERHRKEHKLMQKLRQGKTTLELLDLNKAFDDFTS